jgi:hypothetical protein
MATNILSLGRSFSQIEHAQSFLAGQVRMQTIEYFRGVEHTDKALRGDAYEGASGIFHPSGLSFVSFGDIKIPATNLGGPLAVFPDTVRSWHVFCMHVIGFTPEDPETYETLRAMEDRVRLDERCANFGKHFVVVHNVAEFVRRVDAAIESRGWRSSRRVVEYYELDFAGIFDPKDVPFRKSRIFSYQKEYRIVARTSQHTPTPLVLDIGDINSIAGLTTLEEFNTTLKFDVRED